MLMSRLLLKWQSRAGITLQSPWKQPTSTSLLTVQQNRKPVELALSPPLQEISTLASPQLRPAQSMEGRCWRSECGSPAQSQISWLMLIRKQSLILSQVTSSLTSLVSYWPLLPEYSNMLYDMSSSANHIDLSSAASTYSVVSVQSGLTLCRGIQIFTGSQCTGKLFLD